MMYRFLLFPDQQSMTWNDQIRFTELMGDGNAFPDAKSPGRKVKLDYLELSDQCYTFGS